MAKHTNTTTTKPSSLPSTLPQSVTLQQVAAAPAEPNGVPTVQPWYATAAGVQAAQQQAAAHWGTPCRVPASHRWLAAAAWVQGAANAQQAAQHAAIACATMGWAATVAPPVAFCKANWLFAKRKGWPYVQASHGVTRTVAVLGVAALVVPETNAIAGEANAVVAQ